MSRTSSDHYDLKSDYSYARVNESSYSQSSQKSERGATPGGVADIRDSHSTYGINSNMTILDTDENFDNGLRGQVDEILDEIKDEIVNSLPPEIKEKPQVLDAFVAAMNSIISVMKEGLITQIENFANSQKLSQDQTKQILRSTSLFLKEQTKVIKKNEEIAKKQKEAQKRSNIFKWLTLVITVVTFAASVAATVASAGAATPLLAAQAGARVGIQAALMQGFRQGAVVAMKSLASMAFKGLALGVGTWQAVEAGKSGDWENMIIAILSTVMLAGVFAAPTVQNAMRVVPKMAPIELQTMKNGVEVGSKAAEGGAKAAQAVETGAAGASKSSAMDKAVQFGGATFFSSAQAQEVYTNSVISKELRKLHDMQKEVGDAHSIMLLNDALFKFFSQIIRKESEVMSGESEGITDAQNAASSVIKGFKQATVALSQAV
ncbi:MAG: hypothetical protein WAM28_05600 [Chlamydiales bacterium]